MDQNSFQRVWENGEGVIWEVMTWSEEWTEKGEVLIWCRKMLGIRETKNRTKTNEML